MITNGILLDYDVGRFVADAEAIHSYKRHPGDQRPRRRPRRDRPVRVRLSTRACEEASLSLFVSVFHMAHDPTLLGVFASEETLAVAKRHSHASGVLDGRELGRVFSLLRPNDLLWSYWVNNYLLGKKPPAFDVLYWNNDTTRLPAALHDQLIDIYRDNLIATPGAVVANGTRTDMSQVGCDGFVIGGTTDHITPWDACYRFARRLPGKGSYFTNSDRPDIANEWKTGAEKVSGRWWPHWMEWLSARAGEQRKAPGQPGGRTYPALEAAPGTYVFG